MTKSNDALKPRRGRPSAARANAIDRLIIDVARDMFLAEGFDAVAMEQVAQVAKVSKGTLYARHPSKESLFNAVIEASLGDWSEEASREDHLLTDDIEQRLRHHARKIAESLCKPDVVALQQVILAVRSKFPDLASVVLDTGYRYIVSLIEQDIIDAAGRDNSPARDPGAVARTLVGALTGFEIQEQGNFSPGEIDAFGQRVVDLLIAGRAAW